MTSPPSPPLCFMTDWGRELFKNTEFEIFAQQIVKSQRSREAANLHARELAALTESARIQREYGSVEEYQKRVAEISQIIRQIESQLAGSVLCDEEGVRPLHLVEAMEEVMKLKAFNHFLNTGVVIPRSDCSEFSDEEFVAGLMLLTHDLSRYSVGRAVDGDRVSVKMARNVIEALQFEFAKFDFRNGPLRRKFDGVKYSLKRVEGIVYDLTINDRRNAPQTVTEDTLPELTVLSVEEFDTIRKHFELLDELRETVIKRCRDVQKGSKQAIYSLHRKQTKRANEQLQIALSAINELLPTVAANPGLRWGAFTNCLEEYSEARLFQTWLAERRLLSRSELPFVNADEYIGALCDLTGELGRFAVASATQRDIETVKKCLETDSMIAFQLSQLPIPTKLAKKMDPLRIAVTKLESIIYELTLSNNTTAVGGWSDKVDDDTQ